MEKAKQYNDLDTFSNICFSCFLNIKFVKSLIDSLCQDHKNTENV